MDLVGSVEGSDVIIVDTAGALCKAANDLYGAKRVFASHGIFSEPASSDSVLEVVLNTIPLACKEKDSLQ